jgi:hypothetical protein
MFNIVAMNLLATCLLLLAPSTAAWISLQIVAVSVVVPFIGWTVFRKHASNHWSPWLSAVFLAVWLITSFALALQGSFAGNSQTVVPKLAYAIVVPILLGHWLFKWKSMRIVVDAIPLHWIIGFQLYRAMGYTFLALFLQGRLPGAFALPAAVGDIAIGLSAPFVAQQLAQKKPSARTLALIWNWAGITDLVVAVTCGVLTAPGKLQLWAHDVPNILISAFPLVLIPAFAVPFSIILHLIGLRRLRAVKA